MVSAALPLSTHHFLANTAIEMCPVEGDSTSDEKLSVMAEAICQAGFQTESVVCLFFNLSVGFFPQQNTKNNQWFYSGEH